MESDEAHVTAIVRRALHLPVDPGPRDPLRSLDQWDSLQFVFLVSSLEEAFDLEFSSEQIANITDIRSIVQGISAARGRLDA
jgi:acyl carrier protein